MKKKVPKNTESTCNSESDIVEQINVKAFATVS